MKPTVLTTAILVSVVATLSFATPRPALAGSNLIRAQVMSAKGAAAEAEMHQLRAKAAQAKAAMEAKAATANGYDAMPVLSVACPSSSHWALADNPDRCL